jgi:hypothetical protein
LTSRVAAAPLRSDAATTKTEGKVAHIFEGTGQQTAIAFSSPFKFRVFVEAWVLGIHSISLKTFSLHSTPASTMLPEKD